MQQSGGEVFDLGYQHYQGPREGRMRARKALWVNGMRKAIGIGRGTRAKLLPAILLLVVVMTSIIIALTATAANVGDEFANHADFYRIISSVLLIFSAIIAPELLCPDRREGVIYLYMVRPLTITDYIVGRWLAFFTVSFILIIVGQVILFIGLTLAVEQPFEYIEDNWLDVPRFLAAGVIIAAFTTTLPLAVAAFTTRKVFAASFVIGLFIITSIIGSIMTQCEFEQETSYQYDNSDQVCKPITGEAGKWLGLIDIGRTPSHISDLIMDDENESQVSKQVRQLPAVIPVLWYLIMTLGPALILFLKYRKLSL